MKSLICILLVLTSHNVFARGGHKLTKPIATQIVEEDADELKDRVTLTYENDSYVYNSTEYANPMVMYSTGNQRDILLNGWDIGISAQNIVLTAGTLQDAQNFQNDTYLIINKTFQYGDILDLLSIDTEDDYNFISTTFGSMVGTVFPLTTSVSPGYIDHSTLHQFYFIDTNAEVIKNRLSLHVGPYYSNAALTTTSTYTGWQAGVEIILIHKSLKLDISEYSGHSNVSGSIFQTTYTYNKNLELFVGMGLAAHNSGNYNYGIFGFNIIGLINN